MPAPRSFFAPALVLLLALVPAAVAGAAGDRLWGADPAPVAASGADGYGQVLPDDMPRGLDGVPGAWALPGGVAGADAPPAGDAAAQSRAAAGGTTVTVTATVLPTATIVVRGRDVVGVWTNAPGADLRRVAWIVRDEQVDGEPAQLTAEIWRRARATIAAAPRSLALRQTAGRIA